MNKCLRFLLLVSLLYAIAPLDARGADLRLHFEGRMVFVEGVTPGGDVLIYSVARTQTTFQSAHSEVWKVVRTAAGNGTIRAEMRAEIEPHRLWIVIDQITGRHLVRRTATDLAVNRHPNGLIRHDQDDQGGKLSFPLPVATVFLVRAGEGTWISTLGDGGTDDDDGSPNQRTVLRAGRLSDFRKNGKKAEKYRRDDSVIVLDPVTLRVYEERLK